MNVTITPSFTGVSHHHENNIQERRLKRLSFDSFQKNKNPPHRVFIESHRGVNREEPENTLAAFEKAILLECDSIEMDIWLTKDKIPVVLHGCNDGKINDSSGKINDYIFSEVIHIKLDKNQNIPSLEDVFKLCKNKIFLNLEIKDANIKETFQEVYKLILKYNMQNEIAISSFHHSYHEEIKSLGSELQIEFGFLYKPPDDRIIEFNFERPFTTMNLWYKDINEDLVKKAHDNNIAVLAWFKLTDEETEEVIQYLIHCKIDIICTNDPRHAMKIRQISETTHHYN